MLRIGLKLLPQDGSRKVPTAVPYAFVDQLNTARRFIWNKATKVRLLWMQHHILPLEEFVMVISVGIDVSKNKHDCFIVSSEGEILANVFSVPNTMDGFHCLLQRIQDCEPFPQKRTQNKRKKPNKNAEIKSAAIRRRKRQVQPQNLQVNASRGQNGGGWCCKRLRDRQRHRPVQLPL